MNNLMNNLKYDKRGNLIYWKDVHNLEHWKEFDGNNNEIHYKCSNGIEILNKYDKNNNRLYSKCTNGYDLWYNYDKMGFINGITEKEFKKIEYNIKIREYLSREKCSRFEIMEI